MAEPSGHVFRVDRRRRPVWYAKYRLPDRRQVQRLIGPAWTQRGRPAPGYFTKRSALAWLREVLDQARRGELAGMVQTGVTFAVAVEEYLRWLEVDRQRKPSTLRDFRSIIRTHLLPTFGERPIEDITYDDVERWRLALPAISNRTKVKIITVLYGIMERARRVHRLPLNPVRDIDKPVAGSAASSTSSRPRTSGRSCAPRSPSRTPRSSSPPRSPACAAASSSRCAGPTSTSPAPTCASPPATPRAA